ncbi:hypothetical protein [Psychrobacter sp. I-STPA10]|uniref:hypothetical protein n=1 Tax=Psychrobacter sp. I-STPA10 TaxID=2585769 RepID=UPI001E458EB7|nr:hypothetical protein [Psychrobacter sp. I-STPA10]
MKLSRLTKIVLLSAATLMSTTMPSFADDALQLQLEVNKIVKTADGRTQYVPASDANTGTVIQYKANYSNVSDQEINDVLIIVPIPENMTFTGAAHPASAQATTDGKNYADMPLMRRVNGKLVKIPYSEYKSLRWNIKMLPAHKSAAVSLDGIIK